ncbi:1-acyl-sn-glycerol-3-phosphate acyltransferase [Schaalia meyeri]|uniref:1-acyl-sn-glycerol-3-phosphate acyltransferase n=1 Tax=Schaalia meyeri TaxID=52773 RepID=A0AAP9Y856_9ACTO|nr:lysophospholipid acyltransferase family protein [Schaalia meyeri]QQC44194.1 1-acyl-sn-glycerol-3-phosphate acyltransferase [Schaalia meyeri]SDR67128.1 1-acyl-sn-glycerol-3-phosphate acyltransferases [Schaalia meyeri]
MSPVSGFYAFAKGVLTPLMTPWVKITATGEENLPADGGFLLVSNHLSSVDPLCLCWYFMKRDTAVRFLAKKSMFSVPVFGWIIRGMGLIPVNRDSDPAAVLAPARAALEGGEVVGIYPEGTLTRDPDEWPMQFKSGAARLALDTGVPVIPLSQWGAQDILAPYNAKKVDMRPGRALSYHFGTPVDLSDLIGPRGSQDREAVREATRRISDAVRAGVGQLRDLPVPEQVWDPVTQAGPWWEEEQAKRAKKAKKRR